MQITENMAEPKKPEVYLNMTSAAFIFINKMISKQIALVFKKVLQCSLYGLTFCI